MFRLSFQCSDRVPSRRSPGWIGSGLAIPVCLSVIIADFNLRRALNCPNEAGSSLVVDSDAELRELTSRLPRLGHRGSLPIEEGGKMYGEW